MVAIRRSKLYEQVAQTVEQRIREDDLMPGEALPSEREMMREFGVGRPAVREALFHLQRMGLIELKAGARARVAAPTPKAVVENLAGSVRYLLSSPDGIRHFQEARAFFEIGLARYAAEHATPEEIEALRVALEANRAALGDRAKFEKTDVDFHYVLAVIPKNPIFLALHAAFVEWLVEQRHVTLSWPGRKDTAQSAYDAHAAIYKAIAAKDPDRAEAAMRKHLEQIASVYWEARQAQA
ncbi:MAG: transcriptional regulator NanR [Rhizobiales bacterium]|nr:transcriptional regulator NanR [Hyphomicrobiales bacterium]